MSKKNKLIIAVASILVVVAIGVGVGLGIGLAGNNEENNEDEGGIWFKENLYHNDFGFKDLTIGERCKILVLVNSLDELKAVCNEHNNPAFQEDDNINYWHSRALSDKLREYDDAFFTDKALIIYTDVAGSGASYSIKKIDIENEEIIVYIKKRIWLGVAGTMATTYTFLIDINKEDIGEAKEIKYIKEEYYEKED